MLIPFLKELRRSNLRSIYFNLKYFPLGQGLKMTFRISHRCSLLNLKGNLVIESQIQPGMIQIGYSDVGVFDNKKERAIWNVRGRIIFKGKCYLGNGVKLNVTETGVLTFGNNVNFIAKSAIDCQKEISFSDNCLVSWESLFIDGDYHKIFNSEGKLTNAPQSITVGKHVWFGCRCLILKGVTVADDCVVAAGSLLNGAYTTPNSIIAGSPAKTVKENISWQI